MLHSFALWCESTAIHNAIANSLWAFAAIESMHLLALSAIGGAVLIVDLRLLGLGLKNQPVADVARNAFPGLAGSLLVMVATGIPLFLSEPIKCYYSTPFWIKMASLVLATLFTFTVKRRITEADETRVRPVWLKLVAIVSLTLWFGVAGSGRWIGFSA
jgi:hypothetical protein